MTFYLRIQPLKFIISACSLVITKCIHQEQMKREGGRGGEGVIV